MAQDPCLRVKLLNSTPHFKRPVAFLLLNLWSLKTPVRKSGENRLNLDNKRSIVSIDQNNISDLDQGLQLAIQNVVSNKTETKYKVTGINNFHVFGNFVASQNTLSAPEFFIAIIPKSAKPKDIILQAQWFAEGVGGHNQLRIKMNQSIVAIPQQSDIYTPITLDGDLTYTLQATRVQGGQKRWSPFVGIMGEFGVALQFYSTPRSCKRTNTKICHSRVQNSQTY